MNKESKNGRKVAGEAEGGRCIMMEWVCCSGRETSEAALP